MTRPLLALALGALLLPAAHAQPTPPRLDVAALDALFDRPPKVEVNLTGALLRMAAASGVTDDPDTADLVRGLRGIRVRVYALDAARPDLVSRLTGFGESLETTGWSTLVRVRPDGDETDDVWVYVRDGGDVFEGMAVMSLDHEDGEASFVFIDGRIDPAQVGSLGSTFGVSFGDSDDAVGDALDEAGEDREMARQAREEARQARDDARRRRDN